MNILVLNAGSSSLKYQLIEMDHETIVAKGQAERIGIEGANFRHRPTGGKPEYTVELPIPDHEAAVKLVLDALAHPVHGVVSSKDEIHAVGHRVLHGGSEFSESVVITPEVKQAIRRYFILGPLHNPANLMGIEAIEKILPKTPMVAVFDTAFHQTMPPKAYVYGIPYEYYRRLQIRRYGFHGTSHRYVSMAAARFLGKNPQDLRIICCHLGNGSSITAVDRGKVVDTSMGLTPLEGLLMGTRAGDMDTAVVEYIMQQDKLSIEEVMTMLNKKSGLLGISERSSDMRDVFGAAQQGDKQCKLAVDILIHRIRKYIGAYAAVMGGVDAVVFTAGIGENNAELREMAVEKLEFIGIKVDPVRNRKKADAMDISADDASVKTLVIATNEELMIARDTLALTNPR
ncbi:MAG: acetate kinase [Clostridiales bacterium]|nr:acetate kinase [Clostridiales bacterium]